ncbi:hypothetical protein RB200_19665 [Streptomyces sp. PmtG]
MTDRPYTEAARYRALPLEVEAVQWTGSNAAAMTAFAAHRFAETAPEDRAADPDSTAALLESDHNSWFDLHVGDWVVRREGGWFGVLDDDDFTDRYEAVESRGGERADSDGDVVKLISEIASRLRDATDSGRVPRRRPDLRPRERPHHHHRRPRAAHRDHVPPRLTGPAARRERGRPAPTSPPRSNGR